MHHHGHSAVGPIPAGARRIVLVGNPNSGKSVFFHRLTGVYVDVSNYPGTTVEVFQGRFGSDVVIDTPGVYGVSSFNDEERVARDIILSADVVINVIDGLHLDRDLFLTLQLVDMGLPMVVALNMMDEVEKRRLTIDRTALEEILGVPVIPTVAVTGKGVNWLKGAIKNARPGKRDPFLEEKLAGIGGCVHSRAEALMVLEGDPHVAARHGVEPLGEREALYVWRRGRVDRIVEKVVRHSPGETAFAERLGTWMIRPLTGIPILLLILFLVYELVGVLVAQVVVEFTEETVMAGTYEPWIRAVVDPFLVELPAVKAVLTGEFGFLTMTVTYLLGLLLPLVTGFYLVISLMEDSGYLPRLAALADRALTGIGLNGKAVIPIILGFGCVTMATITTRVLGTRRERTIATFLLALVVPCSAQLGVITAMVAPLGPKHLVVYVLTMLTVFIVVGTLLSRILPGTSSDLLIDLPPLRVPGVWNVTRKTATRAFMFLREAGPLFIYGSLALSIMEVAGILKVIQDRLAPLTVGWLGLPKEASRAFVMGIVRRDFGAAGLYDLALTPDQTVVALVTISLFVPCIASMLVITKERGKRDGLFIWLATFATAFLVGGLLRWLAD